MATKRSVPARQPGAGGSGDSGFESPHKPPAGYDDLATDTDRLTWHLVQLHGRSWRVHVPAAASMHSFVTAVSQHTKSTDMQFKAMKTFIETNMHPEDFAEMLFQMMDPDAGFDDSHLRMMLRLISTCGTARPFVRSRIWRSALRTAGARSGPDSLSRDYMTLCENCPTCTPFSMS